jgi:predicted nucleic acid-binding protein
MADPVIRAKFALDTNLLIDLGERFAFAHAFLETYKSSGLAVPPTVVQELTSIAFSDDHPATKYAYEALANMREWQIYPYDLKSVGHGISEVDARKLIKAGLLPEEEFNDGLVLIETALACIPILVTSDHHLLDIDKGKLIKELGDYDLQPVTIYHPKELLRVRRNG